MDLLEYTEMVGERIQEWCDNNLTYENGCKKDWEEGCGFEPDEISWLYTQKGMRIYDSYVRKAQKLIEKKFPDEEYEDLERYTGIIYP